MAMIIGIPKEIKTAESRVSVTPAAVREITKQGHRVVIEQRAGEDSGFIDARYTAAGAEILSEAADVWQAADMIVKVKEPVAKEYGYFREGLILFTFLHLAAARDLALHLLEKKVVGLAYETLQLPDGRLPLLTPMSEIAGQIGAIEAAGLLARHRGGKGRLMGGAAGVPPAVVMILGAGTSGLAAAEVAMGMGARVLIYDINIDRLREIEHRYDQCSTVYATEQYIADRLPETDIVMGCVLVPGGRAPVVISRNMIKLMEPGSVLVDIAIDQGGCSETSRPTTHDNPTYLEEGVLHYCVTNIPGSMPQTSTVALSNATLPYILKIAGSKTVELLKNDATIAGSLNTWQGNLTNAAVADALDLPFSPFK